MSQKNLGEILLNRWWYNSLLVLPHRALATIACVRMLINITITFESIFWY